MKISVRRKISREKLISAAYQFLEQEGLVRPPAETIPEHIAIIEAICNRDPKRPRSLPVFI